MYSITALDKTVNYLKKLMFQNEQLTASAKIAEKSFNSSVQYIIIVDCLCCSSFNVCFLVISPSLTIATLSVLLCILIRAPLIELYIVYVRSYAHYTFCLTWISSRTFLTACAWARGGTTRSHNQLKDYESH